MFKNDGKVETGKKKRRMPKIQRDIKVNGERYSAGRERKKKKKQSWIFA